MFAWNVKFVIFLKLKNVYHHQKGNIYTVIIKYYDNNHDDDDQEIIWLGKKLCYNFFPVYFFCLFIYLFTHSFIIIFEMRFKSKNNFHVFFILLQNKSTLNIPWYFYRFYTVMFNKNKYSYFTQIILLYTATAFKFNEDCLNFFCGKVPFYTTHCM